MGVDAGRVGDIRDLTVDLGEHQHAKPFGHHRLVRRRQVGGQHRVTVPAAFGGDQRGAALPLRRPLRLAALAALLRLVAAGRGLDLRPALPQLVIGPERHVPGLGLGLPPGPGDGVHLRDHGAGIGRAHQQVVGDLQIGALDRVELMGVTALGVGMVAAGRQLLGQEAGQPALGSGAGDEPHSLRLAPAGLREGRLQPLHHAPVIGQPRLDSRLAAGGGTDGDAVQDAVGPVGWHADTNGSAQAIRR